MKVEDKLLFLQKVDLSGNKLTSLSEIKISTITWLNLENNSIKTCDLKGHKSLKWLNLNKNNLKNGKGIEGLIALEQLSIAENEEMGSLNGLNNVPKLSILTLNGNKIERLDKFPDMPELKTLILDGNPIANMK